MPIIVPYTEVRGCRVTISVTSAELDELKRLARERYPSSVGQIVYTRYLRGAALESRPVGRQVCRIIGKRLSEGGK